MLILHAKLPENEYGLLNGVYVHTHHAIRSFFRGTGMEGGAECEWE